MLQRPQDIRQRYLDAMGITVWVRPSVRDAQLAGGDHETAPAALKPVQESIADVHNHQTAEPADEVSEDSDLPAAAPDAVALPETARGVGHPSAASGTLPASGHAGIRFVQQWWAASGWLIVDTRGADVSATDHERCDRLIGHLGYYLTGQHQSVVSHYIDWPLFENPAIKHDIEEARVYLQQKWESIIRRMESLEGVVLLGEWSTQLVITARTDGSASSGIVIVNGPSGTDMLVDANAKRRLWRDLKEL